MGRVLFVTLNREWGWVPEGTHYIVSDFIQGQSLREAMRQRRFSRHDAVELVAKLASALDYAHNKGIVHRDIKPENIMLDGDGEPHIMDFGLARRAQTDELITREGTQMGTPAYMSPELAKGKSREADARTDIWSLGVILYELLAGLRPFHGSGAEILFEIVGSEPTPLRDVDPELPPELEAITSKCLEKETEDRYTSCAELQQDLSKWLAAGTTPTISLKRQIRKPQQTNSRQPIYIASAVAAALILVVAAILVFGNLGGGDKERDSSKDTQQAVAPTTTAKRVGTTGDWLQDEFLRLRLAEPLQGPLLKDGQYDISLDVQSLSDERMEISEIVLEMHNSDAAARLGYPNSQVHTSTRKPGEGQTMFLDPRERQTISMAGAQVLPDTVILRISHNLGGGKSQFRIENAGKQTPMPRARPLPDAIIYRGTDGRDAIAQASKAAHEWSRDAILFRAYASDRSIVNAPDSGLSYPVANAWAVQFYSHSRRSLLSVDVRDNQMKTSEQSDTHVDCQSAPLPTIEIHKAIKLGSVNNLLCADWNGERLSQLPPVMRNPRLQQVSIDGHTTYVWFLPYLGPESVPVVIDALTGDEVRMIQGSFQRFALKVKPSANGEALPETADVKWDTRLRDYLDQTLTPGFESRLGRMIYSDVTTAIDTGKTGSWGIGWGPTKDGKAHLISVSAGAWFSKSLTPNEAKQQDISENSVSRNVSNSFRMRDVQLAGFSKANLRLVTGPDGRRFVLGTVYCSSTSGIEVVDLTIVIRSFLETDNMTGTRDLFQNLELGEVPNGVLKVDVEVLGGKEVDPLSSAHIFLQAFVVSGRPAYYRISNELPCQISSERSGR